ncbi:MAG TPA: RsmB/NOP family class I SAM-dependent RNA methyltransferase [Opitutaceae bacterium]|nr:RsmB/NOP family class I SAM-dependent RNA methyltransferase [Opitutaceae bacterium]
MSAAPASMLSAWPTAVHLTGRWLERRERVDALLETLPAGATGSERSRCQHLVLGVVRHHGRIDAAIGRLVPRPPRTVTRAILAVAAFELIEAAADPADTGRTAKIVHHAVGQAKTLASPAEARLINAVVRKLSAAFHGPAPAPDASAEELGEYFSHPAWLVRSWQAQFGPAATRALLEWNQQPASVHARWRVPGEPVPEFLQPTQWEGFYVLPPGRWSDVEPLLKQGKLYLQDPATRIPVKLLSPRPDETLLDLCAAPGGKALLIADTMQRGRLVAVDLPTGRIDRLRDNLSRTGAVEPALVQADVLQDLAGILRQHKLSSTYDGVLIDVPCSNTGVMRHRVDVKWRLQAGDFKKHPRQQLAMLSAAARFVGPRGRLVYSTCSIDTEENEHVVREFLGTRAGAAFTLEQSVSSYPWNDRHDGGGAFLLRRT